VAPGECQRPCQAREAASHCPNLTASCRCQECAIRDRGDSHDRFHTPRHHGDDGLDGPAGDLPGPGRYDDRCRPLQDPGPQRGWRRQQTRIQQRRIVLLGPQWDGELSAADRIGYADSNSDGELDDEELRRHIETRFRLLDVNGDDEVDLPELKSRFGIP
jgi:hypothetical protein